MNCLLHLLRSLCVCLAMVVSLAIAAEDVRLSTVTFQNQSGEPALVKLQGPTAKTLWVPTAQSRAVNVGPGKYFILARYGTTPQSYRYLKGEPFDVRETATSYSSITITLHKVIGGNYPTRPITQKEFDDTVAGRAEEVDPVSAINRLLKASGPKVFRPSAAAEKFPEAFALLMKEEYADALPRLREAERAAPDDFFISTAIALCALKLSKWPEAKDAAMRATQKEPGFGYSHYLLGLCYRQSKRWKDARQALATAVRLCPDEADMHYSLGFSSMMLGFDQSTPISEAIASFAEARDEFARTTSLNPRHADAHFGLGFMHLVPTQRNRDAAEEEYNVLKELDSDLAARLKRLLDAK